jgi:hypothetical protein
MEIVAVGISGISTLIALVALVVSFRVARRQTTLQEQQTAIQARVAGIEEARWAEEVAARTRAHVTARFSPRGPDSQLVLHNEGPALARGVNAEVEYLGMDDWWPPVIGLDLLPVDLQPGLDMAFEIPVAPEDPVMLRVLVRWTDGAGEHEMPFALKSM